MAAVTLATMRTQAQELAGLEALTGPVSNAQWTTLINRRLRELHGLMIAGGVAALTSVNIMGTGAASYTLTAVFAIEEVLRIDGNTEVRLARIMPAERHRLRYPQGGLAEAWEARAQLLFLYPAPSSGTYRVWYTPEFTALAADGDAFEGFNGWEQYAVMGAAADASRRLGDTALRAMLREDFAAEKVRVFQEIRQRHLGHPARIAQTRRHERDPFDFRVSEG